MAKRRGILAVAGTAMLVAAHGASAMAADQTVSATEVGGEYVFDPVTVTVSVGDTVTWTNDSSAPHTVTSDGNGPLDSGLIQAGDSFRFTFDQAGDYGYFCELHPGQVGSVTVESASNGGGGNGGGGNGGGGNGGGGNGGGGNGGGGGGDEELPPTDAATGAATGGAASDQLPLHLLSGLLSALVGPLLVRRLRKVPKH